MKDIKTEFDAKTISEDQKKAFEAQVEDMTKQLEEFYPGKFEFSFNRDNSDYIYLVSDLAELKGKKFHGKKNHPPAAHQQ